LANDSRETSDPSEDWGSPAAPPGPGASEGVEEPPDSVLEQLSEHVPYWLTWRETMIGAGLGAAAVVLLGFLLAFAFTVFDSWSLSSSLETAERRRSSDTYAGWRKAYETTDTVLADRAGTVRQFFHTLGVVVPVANPAYLRRQLENQRAYTAAVLEYRFEHDGNRRAAVLGAKAFGSDPSPPVGTAAQAYRLLIDGRADRALSELETAREGLSGGTVLRSAYLEAALAAEEISALREVAQSLRTSESQPTVHEQLLLARAAHYDAENSPRDHVERALERQPDHLGARIERIRLRIEADEYDGAAEAAGQLLDERGNSASPLQRAQLHNLVGRSRALTGDSEGAAESFQMAIEAVPSRAEVYLAKVDDQIRRGALEAARRTVETATAKGTSIRELVEQRARIAYLEGRFDAALDLLEDPARGGSIAPVLRGRILLEEGTPDRAADVLETLPDGHLRKAVARALYAASRAAEHPERASSEASKLDKLVSEGSEDPGLLRSVARIYLRLGRDASGEERRSQYERAGKLLERAAEVQPNRAVNQYLLCELHRERGAFDEADRHCRSARASNPEFLPGMLTMARLRMGEQRPGDAAAILAGLEARFENRWEVASLYVRALLRSNEYDRAADVLEDWEDRSGADELERSLLRGRLGHARGMYSAALEPLSRARESDEYGDEAELYHAHSLVRLGRPEEAEQPIDALTDVPEWAGAAWTVFAELRRAQDEPLEAIENARIARSNLEMETAPRGQIGRAFIESALAWQEHRSWRDSRVERFHDRGVERGDPDSAEMLYFRGLYYLYGPPRNEKQAARYLERAVDLQPHRCPAIAALESAYEETNNYGGIRRTNDIFGERCE